MDAAPSYPPHKLLLLFRGHGSHAGPVPPFRLSQIVLPPAVGSVWSGITFGPFNLQVEAADVNGKDVVTNRPLARVVAKHV